MTFPVAKLGEVCSFVRGLTYSKSDEVEFSSNIVIRATNIDLSTHKLDFSELRYISDSIQVKDDKRLKKDDILICTASGSKSHLGKVAIVDSDLGMAFGGFMGALRVYPSKIMPQYLFNFLVSNEFKQHIESLSDGANINNLKFSQIENLEIPLPPITTQQKIVSKLDAIFAEIDKATTTAEANAKNAEALFQCYLTQVFYREDESWNKVKLNECCSIKPSKNELKKYDASTEVSFMPMESLGINRKLATSTQTKKLSEVAGSYTYFREGDVLLAKITPCFENGKLGIAHNLVSGIGFGSSEYVVFRVSEDVDSNWLYYFLNRQDFRNSGSKHMAGAVGHKRVTKEFIEESEIPLPSISEQKKWITSIEKMLSVSQAILHSSNRKIYELVALKQSILKQAFAGELVKE